MGPGIGKLKTRARTSEENVGRLGERSPLALAIFFLRAPPVLSNVQDCTQRGAMILHDRHHKVSSPVSVHKKRTLFCHISSNMKMTNNSVKYGVFFKQYLRPILDISADLHKILFGADFWHSLLILSNLLLLRLTVFLSAHLLLKWKEHCS